MPTVPSSGHVSSGNIASDRIRVFREDEIFQLEPYQVPLLALLQRVGMDSVPNPRFEWLERDRSQRSAQVNGATTWTSTADGATATVTVDSGQAAAFKVNHMVFEVTSVSGTTNWRARVTAVDTAAETITLELVLDSGETLDTTAIEDNDELLIIGSAYEEFSTRPDATNLQPTTLHNYVQHFRDTWSISDYAEGLDVYGDPEFAEQAEEVIGFHRLDVERSAWWGIRSVDNSTGSQPRYMTDGIFHRLTSNVFESGNALSDWSYGDLVDDSAQIFEYSPGQTKFAFAGQDIMSRMSRPAWQANSAGTVYPNVQNNRDLLSEIFGMRISRLQLPHGQLVVIPHYEIFRSRITLTGADEVLAMQLAVLDLDQIRGCTLNGKGIGVIEENIQSPGDHGRMDGVYSYFGLKLRHEKRHGEWRFAG